MNEKRKNITNIVHTFLFKWFCFTIYLKSIVMHLKTTLLCILRTHNSENHQSGNNKETIPKHQNL
jgi:hypothetical protein